MDSFYLLKWLFLAIVLYSVSMVPHVGLYAFGEDRPILFSQLCGLVVFIFGVYWAAPHYGVVVVPWALCLSFLTVLVWKVLAYCSMRNRQGVLV